MQQVNNDRRNTNKLFSFPLVDYDGHEVTFERRSGKDRRKNHRGAHLARKIISSLNI